MKIDRFAIGVVLLMFVLDRCPALHAQAVLRVEEDWSLQVNEPDEQLNSPQITTAMMPLGANSSTLFFLDINHGSAPDYSAGGLQLRAELNGECAESKRLHEGEKLRCPSETIQWTQVMIRQGNQLKFGIISGKSQTWDSFGGSESFVDVATNATSLDAYRPADSLSNTGAVYAGNRVASLKLLRVRLYNDLGQMVEIPINQSPL
jgi:hypothetical protein